MSCGGCGKRAGRSRYGRGLQAKRIRDYEEHRRRVLDRYMRSGRRDEGGRGRA